MTFYDDGRPDLTVSSLLQRQRDLQVRSYGGDPADMLGDARADYALWNVLALTDELHEALLELKWKPWLTSGRGEWVDRDAFVSELVDGLHFWMNLCLLADASGQEISDRYLAKHAVNAQRQRDGYTGDKDENGRAIDRPNPTMKSYGIFKHSEPELTPVQQEHLRRQTVAKRQEKQ